MVVIGFRTSANSNIGSGHLHRCLTMASGFKSVDPESKIIFLTSDSSEYSDIITNSGYTSVDLATIEGSDEPESLIKAISDFNIEILITDTYLVSEKYLKNIKEKVNFLVYVDDFKHLKSYHVHVLVNPNLYAHELEYHCDKDTIKLLGTDYAQLREEFDAYQDFQKGQEDHAKKVLVTFGGSDWKGITISVVKSLKALDSKFLATIVIGKSFKYGEQLAKEIGLDSRFVVVQNINYMARLIASSDIAISSPSTTFYELAFFRTPSILIISADNQELIGTYASKHGFALSLNAQKNIDMIVLSNSISTLVDNKAERERMSARMSDLVDGMGRFRIAEEILSLYRARLQL